MLSSLNALFENIISSLGNPSLVLGGSESLSGSKYCTSKSDCKWYKRGDAYPLAGLLDLCGCGWDLEQLIDSGIFTQLPGVSIEAQQALPVFQAGSLGQGLYSGFGTQLVLFWVGILRRWALSTQSAPPILPPKGPIFSPL